MPPVGASKGMGRLKSAVCCRDNCRFVVGFVAGEWDAKGAGNAGKIRIPSLLSLSPATKATRNSKKNQITKPLRRILVCRFFEVRCRTSLPQALIGYHYFRR